MCCVHPFWTTHAIFTRIKLWMDLVLRNQPALSFFMSMCVCLNNKLWWRMTSFYFHLVCFILTSSAILTFFTFLMKMYPWMFPLPTIHKMHRISFYHLIGERKNLPSRIYLISHLSFPEIHRVIFFVFHQPLSLVHQIMRMSMSISNFMIMVFVIFSIIHVITILIHLLLIFLSHRYLMTYLLTKWKPLKFSRHFILS